MFPVSNGQITPLSRRPRQHSSHLRSPKQRSGTKYGGVLLLALALVASGCAETPVTATLTPSRSSTRLPAPPETPVPTAVTPLRGTTINVGGTNSPSIAAKIDNHVAARPQVGLETTDIVFEELVEGGLTRYLAVWQSTIPEVLGPVRSIRPMDPDIISPFGGIIAYSGGQERFVELMQDAPVYNAIHGQPDTENTFYRTNDKAAPHNVLVKAQEVVAQHTDLAPPAQQFEYSNYVTPSTATRAGTPLAGIDLRFSPESPRNWTWDAVAKSWLRSQEGVADVDSAGAQLKATNVVVLIVDINNSLGLPKTELIGTGDAWIATDGASVHALWTKASATERIQLVDDAGQPVLLAPGNTWVELVPRAGSVDLIAPATP